MTAEVSLRPDRGRRLRAGGRAQGRDPGRRAGAGPGADRAGPRVLPVLEGHPRQHRGHAHRRLSRRRPRASPLGRRLAAPAQSAHDGPVAISVFDLFSIGIGPSSSHTVGPMRAARTFAPAWPTTALLDAVARVRAELFGSLGATGHGHGSDRAVILGLRASARRRSTPRTVRRAGRRGARAGRDQRCSARHAVALGDDDLVLHRRASLPFHPNGMRFFAYDAADDAAARADLLLGRRRLRRGRGGGRRRPDQGRRHRRWPTRSAPAPSCSRAARRPACRSAA